MDKHLVFLSKKPRATGPLTISRNVPVGYQFLFAKDCFLSGQEQACSRTNFGFWVFVVTMPKMASYWKMGIDSVCVLLIIFIPFLDQTRPELPTQGHPHNIFTSQGNANNGSSQSFAKLSLGLVPLKYNKKAAN